MPVMQALSGTADTAQSGCLRILAFAVVPGLAVEGEKHWLRKTAMYPRAATGTSVQGCST